MQYEAFKIPAGGGSETELSERHKIDRRIDLLECPSASFGLSTEDAHFFGKQLKLLPRHSFVRISFFTMTSCRCTHFID